MNLSSASTSEPIVGLEISQLLLSNIKTGVGQVISHIYEYLQPYWASRGVKLAPMICQTHPMRIKLTDAFLSDKGERFQPTLFVEPEECRAIILAGIDNGVDFQRLRTASSRNETPIVAVIYDLLPLQYPNFFVEGGFRAFRIYLQQTLAVAERIIVSTDKVKTDLHKLGWKLPKEVHVVPLGSRMSPQTPRLIDANQISILYVSTIEPRKGHDLLLEVFDLLTSWGKDVIMNFIGATGWMADDLIEKITGHSEFGSRIRWYPFADDATLRECALSANIGIMPSAGEGFGLFIEEGLSMGLKMIASDIPEFLERSQPNLYFSARDPYVLAETVLKIHETSWVKGHQPRSMRDFTYDLSMIVESVMNNSDVPPRSSIC